MESDLSHLVHARIRSGVELDQLRSILLIG